MTEERKVEVTIEDAPAEDEPQVEVEVNVEQPAEPAEGDKE